MRTKPPKGRLLWAHAEQTQHAALIETTNYKDDSRNKGKWSIRTYPRTVRVDGLNLRVYVVVVREKLAKVTP